MSFWEKYFKRNMKGNTYRKLSIDKYKKFYSFSINKTSPKRAVLSASMTVEATFILPLFLFFSIILIYVINLINFQNNVNEKMYDTARTLSKMEYVVEDSANSVTATLMLQSGLGATSAKKMNIVGGVVGIVPIGSEFNDDMIRFVVRYVAQTPFDMLNVMNFSCVQKACVRKWIGNEDKGAGSDAGPNEDDVLVYITENGTVYHTNCNCTYLKLSIRAVEQSQISDLRNIGGGKYYACELCGNLNSSGSYYITDTGDRFHSNRNCSGLKRSILMIPLSAVEGKPMCSRCGK